MCSDKSQEAIEFWKMGLEYLHSVKAVLNETIKQGNARVVVTPAIQGKDSWDVYEQLTLWSDFNIIVPTLFNLYHGLETIFKGFVVAAGKPVAINHRLSKLLSDFESLHPGHNLSKIAGKYIRQNRLPPIIKAFCKESKISIDEYYQALKYPESTSGKVYQHRPLKYQGKSGLPFFQQLVIDIDLISHSTVALGRSLFPSA